MGGSRTEQEKKRLWKVCKLLQQLFPMDGCSLWEKTPITKDLVQYMHRGALSPNSASCGGFILISWIDLSASRK